MVKLLNISQYRYNHLKLFSFDWKSAIHSDHNSYLSISIFDWWSNPIAVQSAIRQMRDGLEGTNAVSESYSLCTHCAFTVHLLCIYSTAIAQQGHSNSTANPFLVYRSHIQFRSLIYDGILVKYFRLQGKGNAGGGENIWEWMAWNVIQYELGQYRI